MSRRFIIVDGSTVSEARDRQEESRPKKRVRVDEGEDGDTKNGSTSNYYWEDTHPRGPYERDPVYFTDDPSCAVVRVRGFLFKIDPDLIQCCPTMFSSLKSHVERYGLPTEERPFLCALATVEEYRAFLWSLYAHVDELEELPTEHTQLERLTLILKINKKYDIPVMKEWATKKLYETAKNSVFMESCSSASLTLLVETAKEDQKLHQATLDVVTKKWYDRVMNKSTPSVPAMQIADKYQFNNLLGAAYYVHVQDMLDRQTSFTEKGATQLRADPKLNNGQVMRLLTGYWSLVNFWERLRLKPIALPMGKTCCPETHAKCTVAWDRRWISAAGWKRIMGVNSADTLSLLMCLRDQLSNDDDLKLALVPECRIAGLEALKALRNKTQDGLADHFFACV